MIQLAEFEPFRQRYAGLEMRPLTVTAVLAPGAMVLQYNPMYLDGLLGSAVTLLAMRGRGLPDTTDAYDIPLPLACLWRSDEGHPLWAASCLYPAGAWEQDTVYLHKRAPSGRFSRSPGGRKKMLRLVTSMGRDMERRVPMPAVSATELTARCIGDGDAVAELLEQVLYLGKRRNLGSATVRYWSVVEAAWSPDEVLLTDNTLSRAMPVGAAHLLPAPPAEPPAVVGWTPPQWKASLFSDGWRAGTPLGVMEAGG